MNSPTFGCKGESEILKERNVSDWDRRAKKEIFRQQDLPETKEALVASRMSKEQLKSLFAEFSQELDKFEENRGTLELEIRDRIKNLEKTLEDAAKNNCKLREFLGMKGWEKGHLGSTNTNVPANVDALHSRSES